MKNILFVFICLFFISGRTPFSYDFFYRKDLSFMESRDLYKSENIVYDCSFSFNRYNAINLMLRCLDYLDLEDAEKLIFRLQNIFFQKFRYDPAYAFFYDQKEFARSSIVVTVRFGGLSKKNVPYPYVDELTLVDDSLILTYEHPLYKGKTVRVTYDVKEALNRIEAPSLEDISSENSQKELKE